MPPQNRTRLLVGAAALLGIALVMFLLMRQPVAPPAAVAEPAGQTTVVAQSAAGSGTTPTSASAPAASPLASPLQAPSPLAVDAAGAAPLIGDSLEAGGTITGGEAITGSGDLTASILLTVSPESDASPAEEMAAEEMAAEEMAAEEMAAEEGPPVYTYTVVAGYPHDPTAFTQGLQIVDGELYEGTGLRGESTLRRVDLETGEVLQQIELADEYFGEGIVVVGDRIYQLTWQSNVGFVYDRESFEQVDEFTYPTEGWGLTYDGTHLIMSDGTATIYFHDPATLEEVRRIDVIDRGDYITQLNELEYVDGEIFANLWQTDRIARIDPATGTVMGWIDLSGLLAPEEVTGPVDVLNGIAYDAEDDRLLVTGKWWPKLYEIDLVPVD